MATIEVQAQAIRGDILKQSTTARARVQAEAAKALRREPRVVEVGHTVGVIGTPQVHKRGVETWKQKQFTAISKAESKALRELSVAVEEAEKTSILQAPTYEGLTFAEEALLGEGYSVDEINRRRELAAQKEYERQLAVGAAEMRETHVLVAGNQWVLKEDYAKLSTAEKEQIQQIGVAQFREVQEAEHQRFTREHVEIRPGEWVERVTWGRLTPSQQAEARLTGQWTVEVELTETDARGEFTRLQAAGEVPKDATYVGLKDGQIQYEVPGEKVYVVPLASGKEVEVPATEWEEKTDYAKLEFILGRKPSLSELQSTAHDPSRLAYPGGQQILQVYGDIPVIGTAARALVGVTDQLALWMERLVPGIGSPQEAYFRKVQPELERLKQEYKDITYPLTPAYPEGGEPKLWEHVSLWAPAPLKIFIPPQYQRFHRWEAEILRELPVLEESFIPAIRGFAAKDVSLEDITSAEWKQTGISAALWYSPLILKGLGAGVRVIRGGMVRVPSPIITRKPLITGGLGLRTPVTLTKFKIGTLPSGRYLWLPKPTARMPFTWTKPALHMPVKVSIGRGLERAGLSRVVERAAFQSADALKALKTVQASAAKVKTPALYNPQLAARLQAAQQAVKVADTKLYQALNFLRATPKQLQLLEKVTGYKGLTSATQSLGSAVGTAQTAFTRLELYKPGSTGYVKQLARYEAARSKVTTAAERLNRVTRPRYVETPHAAWNKVITTAETELHRVTTAYDRAVTAHRTHGTQRTRLALEELTIDLKNAQLTVEELKRLMAGGYYPPDILYGMRWTPSAPTTKPTLGTEPYLGEPGATPWSPLSPGERARVQAIADASTVRFHESLGIRPLMETRPSAVAVAEPIAAAAAEPTYQLSLTPIFRGAPTLAPQAAVPPIALQTTLPAGYTLTVVEAVALTLGRELTTTEGVRVGGMLDRATEAQVMVKLGVRPELTSLVGRTLAKPIVITRVTDFPVVEPAPWLEPAKRATPETRIGQIVLPSTVLDRTTLVKLGIVTTPTIRIQQVTGPWLEEMIGTVTGTQPVVREAVATQVKVVPKLATFTKLRTITGTRTSIRLTPLLLPPVGKDGKGIDKKKLWFEYELEAFPGVYPGLVLHFPTPLAPIERITEPRPVIKKKRIPLRRKGTYAVAGFREMR